LNAAARRLQFHTCSAGLGKAYRDRLLRGCGSVFAFADVVHFFLYEFSGLGAGRFSFARIFAGAFERLFFRHIFLLSGKPSIRGG
jgi:hypothetical protein